MGAILCELKPLGVVIAVVSIVWLTAIGAEDVHDSDGPGFSEDYYERMIEAQAQFDAWDEGWDLANLEVEPE
jgi:hypothetical protein